MGHSGTSLPNFLRHVGLGNYDSPDLSDLAGVETKKMHYGFCSSFKCTSKFRVGTANKKGALVYESVRASKSDDCPHCGGLLYWEFK